MRKVRRWNVEPDEQDGQCSLWNVECEDGEFVEYLDYFRIERENSRLRLQIEERWEDRKVVKVHELVCLSMFIVVSYFIVDWILK